jgi:hypothetical protein
MLTFGQKRKLKRLLSAQHILHGLVDCACKAFTEWLLILADGLADLLIRMPMKDEYFHERQDSVCSITTLLARAHAGAHKDPRARSSFHPTKLNLLVVYILFAIAGQLDNTLGPW